MNRRPNEMPANGDVPAAGSHGGDAVAVARWLGITTDEVTDLSASLNPEAPDVSDIIRRSLSTLGHYPDPTRATAALADALGVDRRRVVLTNGGAEAIALVARLERIGWVEAPDFALYERHLERIEAGAPRWRSNPHNPTGRLAAPDAEAHVWDEAFWQIATGSWTRGDDAAWRLGSLTKLWACPGLRIGYAIAPDDRSADGLRSMQPRWAVNSLALAVVEELVERSDLTAWAASVRHRRTELIGLLGAHGIPATDTDSCWVLVDHPGLRESLLPHGVIVRDCASFGLAGTHRVAVPDDRGGERLAQALRQVVG